MLNPRVLSMNRRLRGSILRDVSRSFYLSIRLLPAALRDPIALAYLLARATDTIADTVEIDAVLRLERLRDLAALIQRVMPPAAADSLGSFAALQKDEAERTLIEKLPACLRWLHSLGSEDRANIRAVLAKINEGQTLDVQRFQNPAELTALETSADLDRYTYLVAGSVGEFWTQACFRHLPEFSEQSRETMLRWGIDYGKGLQLVNILRDAGADMRAGRCYLPAEELRLIDISTADLKRYPARAIPVMEPWRVRAEEGMAAGIEYACAIQPWRVRLATVLPTLIGARTLVLLREAGGEAFLRKVKVERSEVRRILFTLILRLAAPSAIRAEFKRLTRY
jgi:farnesyl-diphosphate farnesyltransferase